MSLLSCQGIRLSFAAKPVLTDISFHLEAHEKAALNGINGSGKTTLLKIIAGDLSPDDGIVSVSKDTSIGYLAQIQDIKDERTIYEALRSAKEHLFEKERRLRSMEAEMKSASGEKLESLMNSYTLLSHQFEFENGYAAESEILGIFRGLGFADEDRDRPVSTLSGGQKTRVALGRLLLSEPDLLLLDEPTNHLDLPSVNFLENFLANYRGAVLLVSHDRYFLDRIVTKVFDLEHTRLSVYSGNYTEYSRKKAERRKAEYRAWLKQEAEIRHQEAVIEKLRSFNREKSVRRAESRQKALDRAVLLEKPEEAASSMRLSIRPRSESGKDVLSVDSLSKAFGERTLLRGQSFMLRRGEHVAVIGQNGCGKTTLLKMINGTESLDGGEIVLGTGVQIGYFDQEHGGLHSEKTIFDEISDEYPALTETQIRNMLAAFLFRGEDVFLRIGSLSGGEQGRVLLAKLMLSEANFLLLDEPTNHLDALSKEVLEDALREYEGTILFVSHDRFFINQIAGRVICMENGILTEYQGNYDDYLEKSREAAAPSGQAALSKEEMPASDAKKDWIAEKQMRAETRKKERRLKETEEEIASLELRSSQIDEQFALPETGMDLPLCQKLSEEQAQIALRLEELYEQWEEMASD